MTPRACALWGLLLLLGPGCTERPRAPALDNAPVYQNDRAGFRFLVPEGWVQQASSMVPPGRLDRELVLVQYRRYGATPPASLVVSLQDLSADTDLGKLLAGSPVENVRWKLIGPPAEAKVGRRTGQRFVLEGKGREGLLRREVLAVRRGERVCFFIGTFAPDDHTSRDLIRQTFANVVWKD